MLFDIGGGSSELVWLDRSQKSRGGPPLPRSAAGHRCRVGVVTLAERFGGIIVTPASYEAMVERSGRMHRAVRARARPATACAAIHLLGTSGTVTTIAGVHLGLKRYDRNRVDGCWMSAQRSPR